MSLAVSRQEVTSGPLSGGRHFSTAMDILGEAGPDGLTIAALCHRLGVTKGSFYHHFRSMPEFVSRLMQWFTAYNDSLVDLFERERDVGRQFDLAIETGSRLDHAAEAAIRGWARSNSEVATTVRGVDDRRHRYLVRAFTGAGVPGADARFYARLLVDMLVGRQQREHPLDVDELATAFARVKDVALASAGPTDMTNNS